MKDLFTFFKTYKLLILALILLFFTTVILQVNYNKNRMDNYNPDEYFTISTIHPKHESSKTVHRSLNGPRLFTYAFYPGAMIGMINHMGGNVWIDGWKYPGHNYILNNYGISCNDCLARNMKDPNLRYFHYYLKLQGIFLTFLSFIPLIVYLWKRKLFVAMFMTASIIGINFLFLKERSLFYIEPLLLTMINLLIWLYFYTYGKKTISLFWIVLASFLAAVTISLKFSSLFIVIMIAGLLLSKFKKLENVISTLVVFIGSFALFFCLVNWNLFYEEVKLSNVIHDYFSNFWHYATGSNKTLVENYQIYNLKNIIKQLFFSFGGLVFLFPVVAFFGLKYTTRDQRIKLACFLAVILLSIWAIVKQRVYIDRNILPFIPSLVFVTGIFIENIIGKLSNIKFFNQKNRVYSLYVILALLIFAPIIGHSKNYFQTIFPNARKNIDKTLLQVKNANKRELIVIDYSSKIEDGSFSSITQLKSVPETNKNNFKQVMENYIQELSFSSVVLISEKKNNKQLSNYLLPKMYDTNAQFSNYFVFYNKDYDNSPYKEFETKARTIMKDSMKIRKDLVLKEVKVLKKEEKYRLYLKLKSSVPKTLGNCKFYFHGYPYEEDIGKLPENRIKYRFDGWDFYLTSKNMIQWGNDIYVFTDFTPTLNEYKRFNLGIFKGCDKSEEIRLENVKL